LHCHTIKPLDHEAILHEAKQADAVFTVEENTLIGGLGSAVSDYLVETLGRDIPLIKKFGLPDRFPDKYGTQELLLDYFGLCVDALLVDIKAILQENFPAELADTELAIVANNA